MAQHQYLWDVYSPEEFTEMKTYDLIKLYQSSGIIPMSVDCDLCKSQMYLSPNKNCADGYKWRCLNWRSYKCAKKSIRKNTVLECFRLSLSDIVVIFLLMIQGRSNIDIEKKITGSYTTILRLHKCFQRVCKIIIDHEKVPPSPTEIQKIKDAIQSIPNLTKECMFELHTAEIKARQMFGPVLHYNFWKTVAIFSLTNIALGGTGKTCGPNADADCPMKCQDNTTGSITPLATACADEISDCDIVFGCTTDDKCETDPANVAAGTFDITDPDTYPKVRSPASASTPWIRSVHIALPPAICADLKRDDKTIDPMIIIPPPLPLRAL
ncbi:hypothetical protein FO519_007684 [Halicephalobus sp. NKZ332]|nr:hypothetical protein FO519_007684 [Halicephalobus sp. NKZ332]